MEVGKKGKVHCEDIVFLIRKDPKKYARVKVCNDLTEIHINISSHYVHIWQRKDLACIYIDLVKNGHYSLRF